MCRKQNTRNCVAKVNQVVKETKLAETAYSDIEVLYRPSGKANKVPAIMVQFERQKQRDQWLQNRKLLKQNG